MHILLNAPEALLVEVIEASLKRGKYPAPEGWMERNLAKGRCLVLLDGLDEVADAEQRRQLAKWVQQQMRAYGNNRFLVTSRPFGYRSDPLGGVTVLEVQSFTSQQIRRFIHNWYLANERVSSQRDDLGVHMKAEERSDRQSVSRMYRLRQKHARYVNESMAPEGGNRKQSVLTSPLKLRPSIPPLYSMSV